jgi:predicted AlkP superfamily pyrophosphatase or phosphodiesterase
VVRRALLSLLLAVIPIGLFFPGALSNGETPFPRRPKLVVIIVIDQFRYDYLVRFRPEFVARGFKLLLDGGANFVNCRYNYASTVTGPGHATLLTGAYPAAHGIIENEWFDPSTRHAVYCVADPNTRLVTDSTGPTRTAGFSPWRLIGTTLGDELRAATNFQSKVISISLKDRAAILMGGHDATAAYWYDFGSGRFVTSTYYESALPTWVDEFNKQVPAKGYCGDDWHALPETPGVTGKTFNQFRAQHNEPCPDKRFLDWLSETPFMNEIELAFARAAIKNEHLGQGAETDMLTISLSVNDSIGHAHGPYSPEVADTTLRTDRDLARLFADLDKTVGLDNVWIALSADHGVAPTPAFIEKHHLGPGKAPSGVIRKAVEEALTKTFGLGPWIEGRDEFYLYLNKETLKKRGVSESQAEEVAAQAAATVPDVAAAFTRTELFTGRVPRSPLAPTVSNSFNAERSGDVFVVLKPYAVPVANANETTHGSPWSYDAQVPLVIWGSAFKPGVYSHPCQPVDLTPTLAAQLGLTQTSSVQGRPLVEALR